MDEISIPEPLPNCSLGRATDSECHLKTFNSASSQLKHVTDYSLQDQDLIHRRSGLRIDDNLQICLHHEATILRKYQLLQKKCCNPFQKKDHAARKGLQVITVAVADKINEITKMNIMPGQKMCPTCRKELAAKSAVTSTSASENGEDIDYNDDCNATEKMDSSLTSLGLSPLKFPRISSRDRRSYAKRKISQVQETIVDQIAAAARLNQEEFKGESTSKECTNCSDHNQLLDELKKKIALPETPNSTKLQILTLAPNSWSIQRTSREFNVSERMVRNARRLKAENGILATRATKCGRPVSETVKQKVIDFYENDEYSRLCPGKKDFVSIRGPNGKEQKQKRLLLVNLKELFIQYRKANAETEIGFSKFCELRPKWCITVGAAGTHSVCVCTIHQNVKLMLNACPVNIDYKDLLAMIVCSLDSKDCMLQRCENCPGTTELEKYLMEVFSDCDFDDAIEFKQWTHTDRDTLETKQLPIGEFIENLIAKLLKLSSHHYVAKHQTCYLKQIKENLKPGELVILMDFAENYSFIIQDAVQGFHWDNSQATLHTFVVYYKAEEVQCISLCIISDCLRHDTIAVHTFLTKLINYLKSIMEEIVHIHYFSDGSAAQYKNYKNFINLCNHEKDFGITAEWNFFGTSHGKSPCDGIGGTAKRLAARASLQRTTDNQIITPEDLFKFCDQQIQGIKFIFVTSQEIEGERRLQEERFENGRTLAGTRENHHFLPTDLNHIQVSRVTNDTTSFVASIYQTADTNVAFMPVLSLVPGQYIACIYEKHWWIGNICEVDIEEHDALVNFMHPFGPVRSFHWPEREDKCWIPEQHIIMNIGAPSATRTGRQYNLPEAILGSIEEKFNSMKQ